MSPQPICRQYCGYIIAKYVFDEHRPTPGPGKPGPIVTDDQFTPPFVEIRTMFVRVPKPPPPSSIVATNTCPSGPTVTWTSRTKLPTTVTGAVQVAPPSFDHVTCTAPPPTAKLFQVM